MADAEKRFPATAHRRREARKKGQVAKSTEVNNAMVLVGGFMILRAFLPFTIETLKDIMERNFTFGPTQDFTLISIFTYAPPLALRMMLIILPFACGVGVIAVVGSLMQVGFLTSWSAVKPQISRINPISGVKRMFAARAFVEFVKSLIKTFIAGGVMFVIMKAELSRLVYTIAMAPPQIVSLVGGVAYSCVIKAGLSLGALAVLDYFYQ